MARIGDPGWTRRFLRQQLIHIIRYPMEFLRPNHKIDMRYLFQQLGAARLRHAAEEPEHHVGPLFGHATQHSHFTKRLLISHIAHAARIQQHDVRL